MTRPTQSLVSVNLPLPPSVNKAFVARRGSHLLAKSAAYKFWLSEVRDVYGDGSELPLLAPGSYALWLDLPQGMRGDIDNRVKLISDLLCPTGDRAGGTSKGSWGLGVVIDDKHMDALHVERATALLPGRCIATVTTLAAWPSYLEMRML